MGGAPGRLVATLLLAALVGQSAAGSANVANILDVSWTTDLAAGKVTFEVQALQPAGCGAARSGRCRSAPSGPKHALLRAPRGLALTAGARPVRRAAGLSIGEGMEGGSAYIAWWDSNAGQGRVVRAWCSASRRPYAGSDARAASSQVPYYLEPTNMLGSGVLPTAEPLWDESVNVTSYGLISFRFTRRLAAVAGQPPPRSLAPNAPAAFPVAQLDPSQPVLLTGALFPHWSVTNVLTDSPATADKHFMHAGLAGTRTPRAIIVDWNTGQPTAAGQALINAALLDSCTPVVAFASDSSVSGVVPTPAAGAAAAGAVATDTSNAGMSSDAMGAMGMRSAFYVRAQNGWGVVLFEAAKINTNWDLTAAVVLSSAFAMFTTIFAAVARPVELRGADPQRHLAWAAGGFLCTAARTGGHYVIMLLVMTFNVWIILGVLLGHAAGYVALAGVARRGSLPAEVRAVGQEESELEQQRELGGSGVPKREASLLQEVTSGTCCAQNCECA